MSGKENREQEKSPEKAGFFKRILGEFGRELTGYEFKFEREGQLMGELCEHLRQIGLNVTLLEQDSPEAFNYPTYVLGCVKIEGRNLDVIFVQLESHIFGQQGITLYHYYVVRVNIEGLEDKLYADFKSDWHDRCSLRPNFEWIDRTLIIQEVSSSRWKGGELAQLLNADSDLTYILQSEGLDQLEIRPDRRRRCVKILHPHQGKNFSWRDMCPGDITYKREVTGLSPDDSSGPPTVYMGNTVGRRQFPTRKTFEAYDRIAQHIRSVASNEPQA